MAGEVTFRPEACDAVALARGAFRRSMRRARFHWALAAATVFGIAVFAGLEWADTGTVTWITVGIGALVGLGWMLVIVVVNYALTPRLATRRFRQNRSLDKDFVTSWDATHFSQRWVDGSSKTPWTDYHDWFETDHIFAFGLNEALYHFVPKRVLTDDQATDLRAAAVAIAGRGGQA